MTKEDSNSETCEIPKVRPRKIVGGESCVRGVYDLVNAQEEAWRVQGTWEEFVGMITAVETGWLGMDWNEGTKTYGGGKRRHGGTFRDGW